MEHDAGVLLLGLELGVVNPREVVSWADWQIEELENPPAYVLELSTTPAGDLNRLISELGQVAADPPPLEVIRGVLQRMYLSLRERPELGPEFAKILYVLAGKLRFDLPDELHGLIGLDDLFELAERGVWGTKEQATQFVLDFLGRFDKRAR